MLISCREVLPRVPRLSSPASRFPLPGPLHPSEKHAGKGKSVKCGVLMVKRPSIPVFRQNSPACLRPSGTPCGTPEMARGALGGDAYVGPRRPNVAPARSWCSGGTFFAGLGTSASGWRPLRNTGAAHARERRPAEVDQDLDEAAEHLEAVPTTRPAAQLLERFRRRRGGDLSTRARDCSAVSVIGHDGFAERLTSAGRPSPVARGQSP